jgi:hypothetical protein
MIEKKENNLHDTRVLIVSIIICLFFLFNALNGFGSRDMGFGFALLLANIFANASLSFLFKKSIFFKSFFATSFILHSIVLFLVIFSDSAPLINRIVVFLVLESIVFGLFFFFFKKINRKIKNNQKAIHNNLHK